MRFSFDNTHVQESFLAEKASLLDSFLHHLQGVVEGGGYEADESSLNLPYDEDLLVRVKELAHVKARDVKTIIVVGIGGSNLGTHAVYGALKEARMSRDITMSFLEGPDERSLRESEELIEKSESLDELLICIISKSGKTTETIASADILFEIVRKKYGSDSTLFERVVIMSDEDSPLAEVARRQSIAFLDVPKSVGGRYSVLSTVGLFPLAAAGFDIDALVRGAREERERCLSRGGDENPALSSALFLAFHYGEGLRIHDTFLFDPSLEKLGAWYRQLLGESIGKKENKRGEEVRIGITPTVSIGSRDLHSVGQLTLAGPRDKTTTLVMKEAPSPSRYRVSSEGPFSSLVPEASHKTAGSILDALAHGAKKAYADEHLPFLEVWLEGEEFSEYELGRFLQWKMLEIMFLGHLLEINVFDQPAVESYKNATREYLEKAG